MHDVFGPVVMFWLKMNKVDVDLIISFVMYLELVSREIWDEFNLNSSNFRFCALEFYDCFPIFKFKY
jgi:hypothetical protein